MKGYGNYGPGFGGGGGGGGYYPWRNDQQQQQTARSLLDKNGSVMSPFLSSTILNLIQKISEALEKYEKKSNNKHE